MSGPGRMTAEAARRLLGVEADAGSDTLRAARNRAVKGAHPDHGGSEESLRLVLEAHQVLEAMLSLDEGGEFEAVTSDLRLTISPSLAMVGGQTKVTLADGRKLVLTLPAGLRHGDKVGAGGEVLSVRIEGRPDLFVSGDDLCMTIKANAALLSQGGRLKLKTPGGAFFVWIPKQTGTNRIVRVLGKGLPPRGRHPQGALILKLAPEKSAKDTEAKTKRKRFGAAWAQA